MCGIVRCFFLTIFASILLTLPASPQVNFPQLRSEWRSGDYADVIAPLAQYLSSLGDDYRNFEADYMMATSLSALPDHHDQGCNYFSAMVRIYQQNHTGIVDGRSVSLQSAANSNCPPPPPPPPGVTITYKATIFMRGPILQEVSKSASKKTIQRIPVGAVANEIEQFDGMYELVHDGWRGILELKGSRGRYIDSQRHSYEVFAEARGNHILFYIIGLGDENADGRGGQKFEGYLMTQTHDDIAGLTWWRSQPFGFYAIRRKN